MPLLDVVATRGHLDERLRRALRGPHHASAVAPNTVTWEAFLTRWSLALCDDAMASREVERLTLSAATRAVLPRYDAALTERAETVDGFGHTLELLRRHEVTPAVLEEARAFADDGDEGTRTRLRALAEVMADQDRRLDAAGFFPAATLCTRLARAVDRAREAKRPPSAYGLPEMVRWWHVLEVDPARVSLAVALARWLGAHGGGFELQVICEPRRMQMPPPLDRALRTLEAEEQGLELRYGLRDPGADAPDEPLQRWLAALTDPSAAVDRSPVVGAVTLAEAQGPDDEARWVASRVARWIDEGVGAHEIAVVFAGDDPETRRCVAQALDEARVPWSASRSEGLLSSPVARALLGLPKMVARGAEREEVLRALAVLQGNAPRAGEPAPWRVSQALRVLGVESLFDTELAARFKHGRKHHPALVTGAVVASIDALARDLWALAQDGSVAEQCERLGRWVDRAGGDGRLVEESRAVMATADLDPGAQAILRALARDEAGVAGAAALLAELPSVARANGRDGAMSAGDFGEMLIDLARARSLAGEASGGGGGVRLLDARDAV
ncbi:MAG: UvrD-like helicase C-terminal domain, partial [Myxococcaceae bacterium]|nr:UvrD-like helicase C-terminal domain [Myxococcaceae bacterium]